ncbi:MAG: hypothetical protein KJO07_22180 [Deltaproteobacteria bacterium]|nr:hypothetical protein [Deltaproteobacteria bacterium]
MAVLGAAMGCDVEADPEPVQWEDEGLFDEANPAYGRGAAEYEATLSVSSEPTNTILTAMTGWVCSTTASMQYSEVQLDHQGRPKRLSHEQDSSFGWYDVADVKMPFTRNLDNRDPELDVSVTHTCSRTKLEACPTESDPNAQCPKTESFVIGWDCEQPLPGRQGEILTRQCERRSSFWPFIDGFSWAPFFRDLEIESSVELINNRSSFDYDNCTASNGKPFYLRLSQGVGGNWGEDDFVLTVEIDGKPEVVTPSKSGLYSLAIAYCPPDDRDTITVNLSAVEDDLFWDDEYTADPGSTDMVIGRGETRRATLSRGGLFGSSSNIVLLESFSAE